MVSADGQIEFSLLLSGVSAKAHAVQGLGKLPFPPREFCCALA